MYKVCSKLFLAGEYNITFPHQQAIILAIPKYTCATITTQPVNTICSDLFDYTIPFDTKYDDNYQLIIDTIAFCQEYFNENNIVFEPFSITITSELYDKNQKYGLGSSGAIVILIIKSILAHHHITYTPLLLFKLAAILLMRKNNNGSFADIACIAYNENVLYTNFDRQFFQSHLTINALLNSDWNSLKIEIFPFRISTTLFVVWSKIHADSSTFIKKVTVTQTYQTQAQQAIKQLLHANQTQDINLFIKTIHSLRHALQQLSSEIEIPALKTICDTTLHLNACAKSSGAGGGDCAIIFSFDKNTNKLLKEKITFPIILEVNYES